MPRKTAVGVVDFDRRDYASMRPRPDAAENRGGGGKGAGHDAALQ